MLRRHEAHQNSQATPSRSCQPVGAGGPDYDLPNHHPRHRSGPLGGDPANRTRRGPFLEPSGPPSPHERSRRGGASSVPRHRERSGSLVRDLEREAGRGVPPSHPILRADRPGDVAFKRLLARAPTSLSAGGTRRSTRRPGLSRRSSSPRSWSASFSSGFGAATGMKRTWRSLRISSRNPSSSCSRSRGRRPIGMDVLPPSFGGEARPSRPTTSGSPPTHSKPARNWLRSTITSTWCRGCRCSDSDPSAEGS